VSTTRRTKPESRWNKGQQEENGPEEEKKTFERIFPKNTDGEEDREF
jgi:hypothetical protein